MKRFSLVFCLVVALSLVFVGSAFANFGPHGGYITDTDSCAGCHRAHTSFSQVQFEPLDPGVTPPANYPYALLVGNSSTIQQFCYACHGDNAPGAATNVQTGIFDAGPSTAMAGASYGATSGAQPYQTASKLGYPLNGGGFDTAAQNWDWNTTVATSAALWQPVSSTHAMEHTAIAWGNGNGTGEMYLTCTSCHDPHGSSNYRLLKDNVNGVAVGGYSAGGDPDAFVYSAETGYPTTGDGGWLKGDAGQHQMMDYKPDYTGGTKVAAGVQDKSLSAWCSSCHQGYNNQTGTKDYGTYEAGGNATPAGLTRHRHPVDIPLAAGNSVLQVQAQAAGQLNAADLDPRIPLEIKAGAEPYNYQLGCLTCHVAHGSSQQMEGWAAAHLDPTSLVPVMDTIPGVDPDKAAYEPGGADGTSALLRADNRGVCERCHDK